MSTSFAPVVEQSERDVEVLKARRPRQDRAVHVLKDGTLLQLDPAAPHFYLWNEVAVLSLATGRPLFVEREGEEVKRLLPATRRRLLTVEDAVDGKAHLAFEVSNASTYIDTRLDGGPALLQSAQDALDAGKLVEFVYQPSDGRMLALREASEWQAVRDLGEQLDVQPLALPTKGLPNDPLDYDLLRKAFRKCASLNYVPYFYPRDCCAYRAWEMRRMLAGIGVACNKLFHYPKIALMPNGKVQHKRLKAPTPNDPRGYVLWTYHVAPLVYLRDGGGAPQPYVLDPSLFEQEVTRDEWFATQPADDPADNGARTFKETPGHVHYRTPRPYAPYKNPEAEENRWDLSPVDDKLDSQPLKDDAAAVRSEYKSHYARKLDLYLNP